MKHSKGATIVNNGNRSPPQVNSSKGRKAK